ncbi:heat-inducible transcription repressor HrcA [Weissella diestrammenae]|uniref:Heat-inducible transcription repressor HrcA n=1 Tax=Weissella diestrammenae TaxID=1162633 RepID=A0A7G9T5L9_9LACO|nr:heat-inducible transcriptional repressor HrcA [Weissella diestrammenae]MCM0582221.1 heat-inducible transcription repressor HrcA [Weissella diestrammenae]QNN75394.1 heat-inducible transcription repressor HrcA [Weissella diestrammenae]
MLTERQRLILGAIITDYARLGKAVGSKSLLVDIGLPVSSATIRNEMAQLEGRGLLQKEHTSSGRIPSQLGYRYYVDYLMKKGQIAKDVQRQIQQVFSRRFQQVDDLLTQVTKIVADMTGYTVIALKPEAFDVRLSGFQLIPIDGQQNMAIVVTSDGQTTSQSFRLPKGASIAELQSIVSYINNQLVGRPIREALNSLSGDLPLDLERTIRSPQAFLQLFGDILARSIQDQVFIGGRLNVMDFTTDTRLSDMKALYQLLENPKAMRQAIGTVNDGVLIQIGDENPNPLLVPYSLLSMTYQIPKHGYGELAILGPTNLPYDDVVSLMVTIRQLVVDELKEYY